MVEITLVHMVAFSHGGNYIGSETFTYTILTVFNILFNNAALKYNLQASKNVKFQLISNIFCFVIETQNRFLIFMFQSLNFRKLF